MKLTKLQRYTAYCIIQSECEEYASGLERNVILNNYKKGGVICGMCDIVEDITGLEYYTPLEQFNLTEILRKKPNDTTFYWFSFGNEGWKERIKLLKQCIEETHP